MDVHGSPPDADGPGGRQKAPVALPSREGALNGEWVGQALGEWQAGELRLARRFAECRDLGREQLEDLYQETAVVLLHRSFHSEEHLRHALRWGIKHRALHFHRDERRRGEILSQRAPELQLAAQAREGERTPELAALLQDDRFIVTEFLTELSELEQRVFWLMAEGMRYRAIAPILQVPVNEARKVFRACESKRERFQLLYDTGRLCGFRSQTIMALQAGDAVGEELAQRAFAHLEGCAHCRTEHKTNARRLRRSFQGEAAALLPIPVLAGRLGWLAKLDLRVRNLHERVAPYGAPPGSGGIRERGAAMLLSGGAAAKLAAAGATVAVIAGGAIGATHALEHPAHHPRRRIEVTQPVRNGPPLGSPVAGPVTPRAQETQGAGSEQGRRQESHTAEPRAVSQPHEPGGFSYLGVPSGTAAQRSAPARASSASAGTPPSAGGGGEDEQRGGGPFSP
ncbi:MAG: sigma-70 family RNA polymerase sigma factor [Solirubrobacteraceae bacterium]